MRMGWMIKFLFWWRSPAGQRTSPAQAEAWDMTSSSKGEIIDCLMILLHFLPLCKHEAKISQIPVIVERYQGLTDTRAPPITTQPERKLTEPHPNPTEIQFVWPKPDLSPMFYLIQIFWPHFFGAFMSSIFKYSMAETHKGACGDHTPFISALLSVWVAALTPLTPRWRWRTTDREHPTVSALTHSSSLAREVKSFCTAKSCCVSRRITPASR